MPRSAPAPEPPVFRRTRSELTRALLRIDGKPVNLDDYPMFEAIYDGGYKKTCLMTCRQVGKSTTLSNFAVAESVAVPFFKTFFVAPSQEQTHKFSTGRVGKTILYSPLVKKYYVSEKTSNRVLARVFTNGSEILFSYATDDADRCRGPSADRLCFGRETEVLTRTGWTPVRDLTFDHEVADVDDAGRLAWHRPTDIVHRRHTGEMVTFRHRGIALRVTSDHRMWANYRVKTSTAYQTPDRYEFVTAKALAETTTMGFKFTSAATWPTPPPPATVTLPGVAGTYGANAWPLDVPSEAFAEFVGWYIAEGHLQWRYTHGRRQYPRAVLTQNEGRYSEHIERCLQRCGLSYNVQRRVVVSAVNRVSSTRCTFFINAPQLGAWLLSQGKARDKHIPPLFFEHPTLLPILLEALYRGDACYHANQAWHQGVLRTRSRRLADDTHRAWHAVGRPAVIHVLQVPPRPGAPAEPMYDVAAHKRPDYIFWRSDFVTKRRVTTDVVTDEDVYCFTVPHHRPVVRGGFGQKPVITSQCLDEVQDMLLDAVLPVVKECLANSDYQFETYCGTPKTFENGLQHIWETSSMTEWVMRCGGCGRRSAIRSEKQLGKWGPICTKCGAYLNPREGAWVDTSDRAWDVKGFHISRAIMPRSVPACWADEARKARAREQWREILTKLEGPNAYAISMFRNEVLGVSDSVGRRIVTLEGLRALCDGPPIAMKPGPAQLDKVDRVVAGVDWSGGGTQIKSRTVLWVLGKLAGRDRYRTLFFRIFPGTSPVEEVKEIAAILGNFPNVAFVACDAGEGNANTDMLRREMRGYNPHQIVKVRYVASKFNARWDRDANFYAVNRTHSIDSLMSALNRGEFQFPRDPDYAVMEVPFKDILNEYEEVTTLGARTWRHAPTNPDDCLHALNFARFAMQVARGEINLGA